MKENGCPWMLRGCVGVHGLWIPQDQVGVQEIVLIHAQGSVFSESKWTEGICSYYDLLV
jgi:hypothetical protein